MKQRLLPILAVAFLCSGAWAATPAELIATGSERMKSGRWREAETALKKAVAAQPSNEDARALLGIARYHLKNYPEAARDLKAALAGGTRIPARALYYLGMSLSKTGQKQEAADAFSRLLVEYPDSREAAKVGPLPPDIARQLSRRAEAVGPGVSAAFDLGYDTNPSRVSDGDGDAVVMGSLDGGMEIVPIGAQVDASLYMEKYAQSDEDDFMDITLGAEKPLRAGPAGSLTPRLWLERNWSAWEGYESIVGLQCEQRKAWNADWQTEARLRYETMDSLDDTPEHSDADTLGIRLRGTRRVRGSEWCSRVRATLALEDASADLDYLGYTAVSAAVHARLHLPGNTTMDAGLEFEDRGYAAEHPFYDATRDDRTFEIGLHAFRDVSSRWQATAGLTVFTRDSSIDYYACNGVLLTVGFVFLP